MVDAATARGDSEVREGLTTEAADEEYMAELRRLYPEHVEAERRKYVVAIMTTNGNRASC